MSLVISLFLNKPNESLQKWVANPIDRCDANIDADASNQSLTLIVDGPWCFSFDFQSALSAKVAAQDHKMASLEGRILQAQYGSDKMRPSSARSHHVSNMTVSTQQTNKRLGLQNFHWQWLYYWVEAKKFSWIAVDVFLCTILHVKVISAHIFNMLVDIFCSW